MSGPGGSFWPPTLVGHPPRPDGTGPWPSAMIAHDGVGLNDFQRHRANDLAEEGYLALAMDYHGVAVIHPGLPTAHGQDCTGVTGTIMLCTGSQDPLCPADQLAAFTRGLDEAGVDWQMTVYGGARHAFWHPPVRADGSLSAGTTHEQPTVPGVGYHPAHAMRAWTSVLDLLKETLGATR